MDEVKRIQIENIVITKDNPSLHVIKLADFASTLPDHSKQALMELVTEMEGKLKVKPITYVDTRKAIKENLPQMYTPSQLKALATNREQYGMEKAGRQYTPLILGAGLISGLVVLAIVAMSILL